LLTIQAEEQSFEADLEPDQGSKLSNLTLYQVYIILLYITMYYHTVPVNQVESQPKQGQFSFEIVVWIVPINRRLSLSSLKLLNADPHIWQVPSHPCRHGDPPPRCIARKLHIDYDL